MRFPRDTDCDLKNTCFPRELKMVLRVVNVGYFKECGKQVDRGNQESRVFLQLQPPRGRVLCQNQDGKKKPWLCSELYPGLCYPVIQEPHFLPSVFGQVGHRRARTVTPEVVIC